MAAEAAGGGGFGGGGRNGNGNANNAADNGATAKGSVTDVSKIADHEQRRRHLRRHRSRSPPTRRKFLIGSTVTGADHHGQRTTPSSFPPSP